MIGCSSVPGASFYRTKQTQLSLESDPSSKVYIDNKYIGVTPVVLPLDYQQQVDQNTRNVTYWETQPGLATFLTVASLGLYLPFSLIPVDAKTSEVPRESYRNNHFQISLQAPGYQEWKEEVVTSGEPRIHLEPQLKKAQP
jgi:hypothetical protein